MRTAKELALVGVYTALLIGVQVALGGIVGIEIVTVMLAAFSYYFGVRRGLMVANSFSLLRCFIFGFFPDIIILYAVYYNLFVVVFGLLGIKFKKQLTLNIHVLLVFVACFMTVLFTALNDIITPLYYGYSLTAAKAYAVASLAAVVPQLLCTIVTVMLLLPVILKVFRQTKFT